MSRGPHQVAATGPSTTLAAAEGLGFSYPGGRVALRDISCEIAGGGLTLVCGESGSGKTTLLRALCGLIPHFHGGRMDGRVVLAGLDTRAARAEILGRHAGMMFQDPERQSVHRTVLRDVAFGPGNAGVAPDRLRRVVSAALEEVDAGHLIDRRLDELSGGERQRVALAGVLACGQPLLLLDEPVSQIDAPGRAGLPAILDRLQAEGRTLVVTDHSGAAAADGRLHLHGGALTSGEEPPPPPTPGAFPVPGDDLLVAKGLTVRRGGRAVISDRDLRLARGEIGSVTGPNGAGKTSLLMALAGPLPLDAGEVLLAGRRVSGVPLAERFPMTALIPQDPRLFFLTERVGDEVALGLRPRRPGTDAAVTSALTRFGLSGAEDLHPLDLSSGQRQRVALAAAWAQEPDLLLLDEPTRGLDRAQRDLLIAALADHAHRGGAALVATHDADLVAALPGPAVRLGAGS